MRVLGNERWREVMWAKGGEIAEEEGGMRGRRRGLVCVSLQHGWPTAHLYTRMLSGLLIGLVLVLVERPTCWCVHVHLSGGSAQLYSSCDRLSCKCCSRSLVVGAVEARLNPNPLPPGPGCRDH